MLLRNDNSKFRYYTDCEFDRSYFSVVYFIRDIIATYLVSFSNRDLERS